MATKTTEISIEPLTRIEGHMGIHAEADLEAGKYVDAHCYATMFRGLEEILKGREPADAIWLTQRTCGVCPTPHATASVMAVDMAYNAPPPPFAIGIRNRACRLFSAIIGNKPQKVVRVVSIIGLNRRVAQSRST